MSTVPPLDVLRAEAHRLGITLDTTMLQRFATYLLLLEGWRGRAGLTAVTDPQEVQRRHFGEALALLAVLLGRDLVSAGGNTTLVDLGTGAGFPGLPMRIVEPGLRLTLVEANARRSSFLHAAVEALGLEDVRIVQARAEDAGHDPELRSMFDVAVARALAPLAVLVEYALPLLREGGVLAAPKGSRAPEELRESSDAIAILGGIVEGAVPLSLGLEAPPQQVILVRRVNPIDNRYPRRAGVPSRRPLGLGGPARDAV
jgi:16S rRNA (guanine527-N7)-methyltransferase